MKNSKRNNNLGLFGLLVFTLALSQGWVKGESAHAVDMASQGDLMNWDMIVKTKEGGKTKSRVISVTGQTESVIVLSEPVKEDGKWVKKKQTVEKFKVKFDDTQCTTGDCEAIQTATVANSDNWDDIKEAVRVIYESAAQEQALARYELDKRKKKAERCEIRIDDEEDESLDVTLSGRENKSEKLNCQIANFNEKEFKTDEAKYRAFKSKFGDDLKDMALSGDMDEDMASIFEEMGNMFNNEQIEDFLWGMENVSNHYQRALSAAEKNDRFIVGNISTLYTTGMAPKYELDVHGRPYFVGVDRLSGSPAQVDAYASVKDEMVRRMRIAMQDPSQLTSLGMGTDSIIDRVAADSFGRGGRVNMGSRTMPQVRFDRNSMVSPNGQRGRGTNNYDSRYDNNYNGGNTSRYDQQYRPQRGGSVIGQNTNTRPYPYNNQQNFGSNNNYRTQQPYQPGRYQPQQPGRYQQPHQQPYGPAGRRI